MTNTELADEIERAMKYRRGVRVELDPRCVEDIIAALRRVEPVLGECEECGHTIVTPLKRLPERQPSSDQVLVPAAQDGWGAGNKIEDFAIQMAGAPRVSESKMTMLIQGLLECPMSDPNRGKSGEGRWLTISSVPPSLIEQLRSALAAAEAEGHHE